MDDNQREFIAEQFLDVPKVAMETLGGSYRQPPVRRIVEEQIKHYQLLIKQREDFLAALDAQPGVEKVLDTMRKLGI